MTLRIQHGANSQDFYLMFLADCNLVADVVDGDAVVFDEATERFVPSSSKTVKAKSLNLSTVPTSAAGLSSGDIWANSNVLTIVP